jgi:hypothetical protein
MAIRNRSTIHNCLHCGTDISDRPPQAFFCGQSCTHKYHRKEAAELRKPVTKECGYCTKPFVDDSPVKNRVYCSNVCKKKARTVRHGGIPRARLEPRTRPIVDGQRQCVKCDQWKPIEDFPKRKVAKFGVTQECRRCTSDRGAISMAKSRKANPDKFNQYMRDWKKKTMEAKGLPYVPKGPVDEEYKKRVIENAYDRIIESNARQAFKWWFEKKTDDQVAAWYEAMGKPWLNPRLSDAQQWKIRYALDLEFNLSQKIRLYDRKIKSGRRIGETIRLALKRNGECPSLIDIIDYDMKELKIHLEKQFTKGMTWEKFVAGKIHIDHIIPLNMFDVDDQLELKSCWALPNLRPMWAGENIRKGAQRLTLI